MQVNNSVNLTSKTAIALGKNSSVPAQELRTRAVVREAFTSEENETQKIKSDNSARQRFDIDEQAIALIEREQSSSYANSNSTESFQKNNPQDNPQNSYNSGYDTPSNQNQLAVAAYQSVDAIAQRDNIQQIFGVDLFA